jgi:N-acetylneuraminic acid mutarotase
MILSTHLHRISLAIFILVACVISQHVQAQTWTQKSDLPVQGRWGAYCFAANGKVYAGGGYVGGGASKHDLWEYNPTTNEWIQKADLPGSTNRTQAVAFTIGDKGYVGLGSEHYNTFGSTFLSDLWEYDPANDSWNQKASLPDSARHGSAVFVLNDKAYVVGGYTDYSTASKSNDTWEYDPATNQWQPKEAYPLPYVYDAQGFTIGNNGYVTGGRTQVDTFSSDRTTKATFRYNAADNSWEQRADYSFLDNGRDCAVAFTLNNKAYVGLGQSQTDIQYYYVEFLEYDEQNDAWTPSISLPVTGGDRAYAIATVTNGKAYIGGGFAYITSEHYYDDWFEFTPENLSNHSQPSDNVLRCYPNPTTDLLRVGISEPSTCRIYDAAGKLCLDEIIGANGLVDVSKLANGLYTVEVAGKSNVSRVRFVISR